jgi:small acid-soluble spore protein I (minor)
VIFLIPNIDIRNAVLNNLKGTNHNEIELIIKDSIEKSEEVTLPGLGVLMEVLWKAADENLRNQITNIIANNL